MNVDCNEIDWDELIKMMIKSEQIWHNEIVGFYIFKSETYHFKDDLIAALKSDTRERLAALVGVCEEILAEEK